MEFRTGRENGRGASVTTLESTLSSTLALNEKEREAEALFIAINEWHLRNHVVWSVPGQIFSVGVRTCELNIFVTTLISPFSLYFASGAEIPNSKAIVFILVWVPTVAITL
ncbi:hypothetical protein PIB30_082879 [Stylosanthes scabra]|uniref:Uncharacterized protein n=1 Tax=Stylosanthes scabra TaxID=79078 RepID=A0ABU6XQ91_9FABA|nr:hypothetical protein [Stylosanthes scabra]